MDISYSFMIPILEWVVNATHSYGLAIVALTILVRILVHPLVISSTRAMQRMSQLQPSIQAIKTRYKDDPEMFQKKAMEFYSKNKINPLGGCLPTLVQLPVLFALFATFTGPPFGDKALPVTIKVVPQQEAAAVNRAQASRDSSPYVAADGALSKVVVFPGDCTVVQGSTIDFGVRAIDGTLPQGFKAEWRIVGDAKGATISAGGQAKFPAAGEFKVEGVIPGVAKNESFGFISSLGKVAVGFDLLKPQNFDNIVLIVLFGATMYLSQKIMVQPPAPNADPEQLIIQQQTQKTMPIALTAMFFFFPLPSGVFLYMVVSNVIQTFQSWLIMRQPAPALVDVLDGGHNVSESRPSPAMTDSSKNAEEVPPKKSDERQASKKKDKKKK